MCADNAGLLYAGESEEAAQNAFHSRDASCQIYATSLAYRRETKRQFSRVPAQVVFNRQLIDFLTRHLIILFRIVVTDAERELRREMLGLDLLLRRRRRERKLSVRTSLWSCLLLAEKVHTPLWGDRAE